MKLCRRGRRNMLWRVLKDGRGRLSMASAHPAVSVGMVPARRIVYRHSLIVRVCHWINALCFLILLMSGLQIFNANPQLNFGYATDFKHPFFSLSSRQDGDNLAGATN